MRTRRMMGAFLLWLAAGPAPGQVAEDAAWMVLDRGVANTRVLQRSQALAALSTLGTNPRALRPACRRAGCRRRRGRGRRG